MVTTASNIEMTLYRFLDIFFVIFHCLLILFNLFGWIWPKTRKLHRISLGLTVFSWLVPGIWYGFGYCFLTDWHWDIKEKLGHTGLPASFNTWLFRQAGIHLEPHTVDIITVVSLVVVVLIAIYFKVITNRNIKA